MPQHDPEDFGSLPEVAYRDALDVLSKIHRYDNCADDILCRLRVSS